MAWKLFDYIDRAGQNVIKDWTEGLQKRQRGKLNAKLTMLQQAGTALYPQTLTHTPNGNVKKLRVKGDVQLRPMVCEGPIDIRTEFTLLIGAIERGGELEPGNAVELAAEARLAIIEDDMRRGEHERVE